MPGDNKKSFLDWLVQGAQDARDAKVGAVGAGTVRQLYNEGKSEEAQEMARNLAIAQGSALSLYGGASLLSAANNYLNGYKYYRFGKNILNRALTAYDIYDSSKTLFGDDGVKKTYNLFKNKEYWNGVKSGIVDISLALAPLDYLKSINFLDNLKSDLKFAQKTLSKNKSLSTNIYNVIRPIARASVNISGVRDITNPILYGSMMLNAGHKGGLDMFKIFENNPYSSSKIKSIWNNAKNRWKLSEEQNLDKVYKQYLLKDTIWEDLYPSGLSVTTDPLAYKLFSERGRYSHLPIYDLSVKPGDNISFNYTSEAKPHFVKRNDKWEFSHRGTYDKKGRGKFKPVTSPNQSPFSFANLDIGGHYMAATPRHDLNTKYPYAGFGNPQKWFDIGIMDTQHFTPDEYISKWKENKWKTLPITTLDVVGRDFNLFGKGTFSYQAPWTNYSDDAVVTFHKDIQPLNESFISKWKKQ